MMVLDALNNRYHYRAVVASGATSDPILLPRGRGVGIAANPASAGTATVEFTLSSSAEIEAGTAIWHTLTETLPVAMEGINAVRLSAAGGSVEWEVSA